jgi:hypothetical protein
VQKYLLSVPLLGLLALSYMIPMSWTMPANPRELSRLDRPPPQYEVAVGALHAVSRFQEGEALGQETLDIDE